MCENCVNKEDCDGISISAQMQKEQCISEDYSMFEEGE